ncbi:putative membrane protein [Synechococcus sp. BOUM118]|nr:putative membrane protein [Synechococcus sp. BOUM118]
MTPNTVRQWLSLMTAVMLFAHITTQVGIYAFGADKHWLDVLNMDRELNLPTLFSTMLLLTAARLLMQLSKASLQESADDWTLLSRIFMFLAVDEALQIHEILILPDLRHHIHPALASTWVIPYGLVALGLLWRFRHFLTTLSAKTSNSFLCAGGVYITGAIGMEMVGSFAVRSGVIRLHSFWYGAITGIEESLEIMGLILFIHALMRQLIKQSGKQAWILKFSADPPNL